jgi:phage terminase Nu1 subunit (DNA packaging protein)
MKINKPAEVRPCFVNEHDLAAISGIAVRTLQSWRLRGIGPPWRRLGSAIRYNMIEFEQWVNRQPCGGERPAA